MSVRRTAALGIASLMALALAACGVAFTSGTRPVRPPVAFSDGEHEPPTGERDEMRKAVAKPVPTLGVSLVVNGTPFDAGPLPPPPIPVVLPP